MKSKRWVHWVTARKKRKEAGRERNGRNRCGIKYGRDIEIR